MIPLDLTGKVALVTGVGDDMGFAWHIAKTLQAAGARLIFSVHPRLMTIVENILERDLDAESRVLPFGQGDLKVEKVLPATSVSTPWKTWTRRRERSPLSPSTATTPSRA